MVIAAIVGYLLGSIPTAMLVGRFFRVDPTVAGDGNPGWWNMRGLVGDRPALIVLAGDVAKGALAAVVGSLLWGPWWTAYVAVGAAMVGHAFPAFANLRGGRSILTFVGGFLVIAFVPAVMSLVIGAAVGFLSSKFAYGARAAMFLFPFVMAVYEPRSHVATAGVLMTFIGLRFLFARTPAHANYEPVATSLR